MTRKLYIDGAWVEPKCGATLPVIDPATEETIAHVAAGDAVDIDRAARAAREAFESGWARTKGAERARYLRVIAAAIKARRGELAQLEVRDNGKPLPEAQWDVDDAAGCFDFYADLAEQLDAEPFESVALPDARFECRVRYEPVGVAGQIIPWNYPLLMAAWKVAPALAAGCTCVLKPSEMTPLTAIELAGLAHDAQLPRGVLNVVTGTGPDAGAPLSVHPMVDKLAFTGSVPTGSRVMSAAAQDIKNVSLELGGKSPFVVCADADIEAAVEWILFGIFWNQGQVCSATSRLIVDERIAADLLARLVDETRRIRIGNGLDAGVLLGPLVSAGQLRKVRTYIETARGEGCNLLTGGERPPDLASGYFLEPTIFTDVPAASRIWNEEVFGPVLCVRTFRDEAQAVRMANDTPYGLAAAVMSSDSERCERIACALRAGIVWINCSQPTFTQAPWGGMKRSGIGRELGRWGLHNYLESKQLTRYVSTQPWGWYMRN